MTNVWACDFFILIDVNQLAHLLCISCGLEAEGLKQQQYCWELSLLFIG